MSKLDFESLFRVEATGFTGGIFFLWNSSIEVYILHVHCQYIHMRVKCSSGRQSFLCSAVYGSPHKSKRDEL